MKFKFYELIKNGEIDNRTITLLDAEQKFIEEASEVVKSSYEYRNEPSLKNLKNLLGEIFDVIQVLITIIFVLKRRVPKFEEKLDDAYWEHIEKLHDRGWTSGKAYTVTQEE